MFKEKNNIFIIIIVIILFIVNVVESEIREHCQMLHFYPSDKELEIHKGDVDFEILSK